METTLFSKTVDFVKEQMKGYDGSHDWFHIERVLNMARKLAIEEWDADMEIVELGALVHDVQDRKYSGSELSGPQAVREFFESNGLAQDKIEKILNIIKNVSFSRELENSDCKLSTEEAIVQDADRLDALGAVGIGRAFTFGGKKGTAMYDPSIPIRTGLTKEEYQGTKKNTTVNHFYEKLFTLQDKMKTNAGKRLAKERHIYMSNFLERFFQECKGDN